MGEIVHIECGKPPSECDCPVSIRRPLKCVVRQVVDADRTPSGQTTPPKGVA